MVFPEVLKRNIFFLLPFIVSLMSFLITDYSYNIKKDIYLLPPLIIAITLLSGIIQYFIDKNTRLIVYVFSGFFVGSSFILSIYFVSKNFNCSLLKIIVISTFFYTLGGIVGLLAQLLFFKIKTIIIKNKSQINNNSVFIPYNHKDTIIAEKIKNKNQINNNSVFISYSHEDIIIAEKIKKELEKNNFQVIIDVYAMKIGDNIESFIKKCIRENRFTLVIVSANSLWSAWVALEIIYSKYESDQRDHHLLPCIIDGSIFDKGFATKTLCQISEKIKGIDEIVNQRTKIQEGFEDIQDDRTRLIELKSNLTRIIGKLKNELCQDLSKENFNKGIKKIIKDLNSYQNKTL